MHLTSMPEAVLGDTTLVRYWYNADLAGALYQNGEVELYDAETGSLKQRFRLLEHNGEQSALQNRTIGP